ncbi:zinc ribbon domain-containing protein [candidate division KSB1 bacterium]|nr:zinc ribbon domain-containing protein [candidate division KSB1 bacterium]
MPIYEYRCKQCHTIFEKLQSIGASNENVICPECNATKPEKILSAFSSSGFMSTASSGGSCGPSGSPFT